MNKYWEIEQTMNCLAQQVIGIYDHSGLHGDVFEQFTGLLDAKGNEIYEGDIVLAKDHNPDHYRIEFREGGFCGVWGDGNDEWYPVDINHFYDSTGCCIEIIGNIHQP